MVRVLEVHHRRLYVYIMMSHITMSVVTMSIIFLLWTGRGLHLSPDDVVLLTFIDGILCSSTHEQRLYCVN